MNFQLKLAARYLWGRKLRTFLTTLAIVFGVLVIFGMNILMPTMWQAFQANFLAVAGQVDVTVTQKSGETFSSAVLNRVKGVPGVRTATASLSRTINIPSGFYGRDANLGAVNVVGLEPKAAQQLRDYPIKEGRFLRPEDERGAVISSSLAQEADVKLGGTLRLPTTEGVVKLTIVGLLPARTLPGNEEVLVTLTQAQKIFEQADRINTVEANFDTTDSAQRESIQAAIAAKLGSDYQMEALSSGSEFMASMQMGESVFMAIGVLALFMGGFIIFNTFRTVVAERRHDIGMLRAVGASRRTVTLMFLAEGLLQGLVGTGLGLVLGYGMGAGILLLMGSVMESFLHLKIGAPVINPSTVVTAVVLGVGVTLLAALLPARTASRLTPLEALRPSALESERRTVGRGTAIGGGLLVAALLSLATGNIGVVVIGGLLCLAGLVLVAPALVRPIAGVFAALFARMFAGQGAAALAEGNLNRQPSRAAITASATMIGLAIIVATAGLATSMIGGLNDLTRRSLGSDYLLMPPSLGVWSSDVGASSVLADRLRSLPGVGVVSTLRYANGSISGVAAKGSSGDSSVTVLGIDPVTYPEVSGLGFTQGDAKTAYGQLAEGRTIIVNGILAVQAGVKVGNTVNLATPQGVKPYRVVGVAGDLLNAKIMTGYISQANLKADYHKTEDIFIQINLAPGADRSLVETRLKSIVADYPQFSLVSGQEYLTEMMQQMNSIFSFMYVVLAALALPSLIAMLNTLAIGVIERTREIGMLRAIGATRSQVRRTILTEAVLLAAVGTAFGLLGGLYLGYVMVLGIRSSGIFPMEYSFPLAGLLAAIAVGLLFGVVAALLPARQAARLEIVKALRYE